MPTITVNPELNDKWQNYLKKLAKTKVELRVGFLGGDTYPDGTSVAYVAAINEYGKGDNPKRPFVGETVKDYMPDWIKIIKKTVNGDFSQESVVRAYELAGMDAEGRLREQIKTWPRNSPRPNAFSTVWAKYRRAQTGKHIEANDPEAVLIDTGVMIGAIRHELIRT